MPKVKATREFYSTATGSKDPTSEPFDYDLDKDPEKLKELGLVEPASKAERQQG